MRLRTVLLVTSAALGVGGCAVVGSTTATKSVQGIAYALPKGQILITASRRPIDPSIVAKAAQAVADAQKALKTDQDALSAAQTAKDDAKTAAAKSAITVDQSALDAANANLEAAKAGQVDQASIKDMVQHLFTTEQNLETETLALAEAKKAGDANKIKSAQGAEKAGQAAVDAAMQKLAPLAGGQVAANILKLDLDALGAAATLVADDQSDVDKAKGDKKKLGLAQAKLKKDQASGDDAVTALVAALRALTKYQEQATFTPEPIAPDPNARYVANLRHNWLRDDHLDLTITNGLLNTSNVVSTDETGAVVLDVADVVATVAAGGPWLAFKPGETCSYSLTEVFDPIDEQGVKRVNGKLAANHAGFRIEIYGKDLKVDPPRKVDNERDTKDALVYRIATSVVIAAVPSDDAQVADPVCPLQAPLTAQPIQVVVPDSRTAFAVEQDAGAFTTTKLGLGFSNGMLTSYSADRPSEIAGFAKIVPQVLNTLMTVPTQVVQAKVNFDTAKTQLVNQQTQLQQARIQQTSALINARAAVVSARTALLQAELGQPAAVLNGQTSIVNAQGALATAKIDQQTAIAQAKDQLAVANKALQDALAASAAAATQTPQ